MAPVPETVKVPALSKDQVTLVPQVPDATTAALALRAGKMENTKVTVSRNARIFDLHLYIGHLQKEQIIF
jgi:hypothetical protein